VINIVNSAIIQSEVFGGGSFRHFIDEKGTADNSPKFHILEHGLRWGNGEDFAGKLPENIPNFLPIWGKPALHFSTAMRCTFHPP
jgi:hypothetical protein